MIQGNPTHGFLVMVRKELRSVAHERTILIAIVIQLFIASFSSALLVGLLSLYDPESIGVYARVRLGVGFVGSPSSPLIPLLRDQGIRVTPFANPQDAETAFQQRRVEAIVVSPEDTGGPVEMQLYLPRADAQASLILMVLQDPLKRYENVLRGQRGITVRYTDLQGLPPTTFEFLYSIILPVLMFFPAFVAGSMVVDSLSEEMENNTLETLLSAPVSLNTVVDSKIAAAVALAGVQSAAWLALLRVNHIDVQNLALVWALAAIVAGIIAVTSAFITLVFKDRERSQFVYALLLLVATSASYLLDVSPIRTMTRLAIGDAFTGAANVAVFVGVFGITIGVLLAGTRRAAKQ
jgi:ABC-2 type transport system permease protein